MSRLGPSWSGLGPCKLFLAPKIIGLFELVIFWTYRQNLFYWRNLQKISECKYLKKKYFSQMHKLKSRTIRVYGSTLCTITKEKFRRTTYGNFWLAWIICSLYLLGIVMFRWESLSILCWIVLNRCWLFPWSM